MMFKLVLIFFFTFLIFGTRAENKDKIINNLNNTSSFSFEFEQNINGKIEEGKCTIKYPKKIYCAYNKNNKNIVLVSKNHNEFLNNISISLKKNKQNYKSISRKYDWKIIFETEPLNSTLPSTPSGTYFDLSLNIF